MIQCHLSPSFAHGCYSSMSKNILMGKWHLIQNQPYLRNLFKKPSLISYRKGKSLNYKGLKTIYLRTAGVVQARQHFFKNSVMTQTHNKCRLFRSNLVSIHLTLVKFPNSSLRFSWHSFSSRSLPTTTTTTAAYLYRINQYSRTFLELPTHGNYFIW